MWKHGAASYHKWKTVSFDLSRLFKNFAQTHNYKLPLPACWLLTGVSDKKFRIYLQNPFTLITDDRAIRWLNTSLDQEKENGRLSRWICHLQSFTVVHKPGTSWDFTIWLIIFPARHQALIPGCTVSKAKVDGMATITSIFNPDKFLKAQRVDLAIKAWALLTNVG